MKNQDEELTVMELKATIQITETNGNETKLIQAEHFDKLFDAHSRFDVITEKWSEWDGKKYTCDLIAHHPKLGDLCRRTMYSNTL